MKTLFYTTVLAFAIVGTSFGQIQNYQEGDVVADFTVTDTEGHTHKLSDYTSDGKYVLLDFFFDTCPPCQATVPTFSELYEKYGCNQGDIILISMNNGTDSDDEVVVFEDTYAGAVHAPAVSADGGADAVDTDFHPAAYPTYCLINPEQKLIKSDIWPIADVSTFEDAFPVGSGITPKPCAPAAIEDVLSRLGVNVYPNPATEFTSLYINMESAGVANITVMDMVGNVVALESANLGAGETRHSLATANLAAGNYVVRVQAGNALHVSKLAVVR